MNAKERIRSQREWLTNILRGVGLDYKPDDDINDQVAGFAVSPPEWSVDAYQLESNFADVGRLLERLVAVRRDLWDIEARLEQTALQYIFMKEQVRADSLLAIAQSSRLSRAEVVTACGGREQVVDNAVAALESRHAEPGSALNYAERVAKLRYVLAKDIESCFVRSVAVASEAKSRYAVDRPLPSPSKLTYATFSGAAFLDDWMAWYRVLARELEMFQSREAVHEVMISFGQPQRYQQSEDLIVREGTVQLVDDLPGRFKAEKEFEVNLARSTIVEPGISRRDHIVPMAAGHASLKAFAVKAVVANDAEREGWRFNIRVRAPNASNDVVIVADGSSSVPLVWSSPPGFMNRSARGKWSFRVLSATVNDASKKTTALRSQWPILDLQLCLRVAGSRWSRDE